MAKQSNKVRLVLRQLAEERKNFDLAVAYIKLLALLSVERAQSGHPGLPLGCAPLTVLLYRYILRFTGSHPRWGARDRFILSAGHGSILLYALQYLFGHGIKNEDLSCFRTLGSATPGHPERNLAHGIETTTGPLGQGLGNGVGIALEQKLFYHQQLREKLGAGSVQAQELAQWYLSPRVFVLMGDGCMMEGITQEAASLAGHLGLGNLIVCYDANNASIDGKVELWMSENVAQRFMALGWEVVTVSGGEDVLTLCEKFAAISEYGVHETAPKLLIVETKIGAGLPDWEDDPAIHGRPAGIPAIAKFLIATPLFSVLGGKPYKQGGEATALREAEAMIGEMITGQKFPRREEVLENSFYANERGLAAYGQWKRLHDVACRDKGLVDLLACTEGAGVFRDGGMDWKSARMQALREDLLAYRSTKAKDASRNICGAVLGLVAEAVPQLVGGSADLVASTKATIKGSPIIAKGAYGGRNIAFGVREHGMGALGNGIALGGRMLPFTSTFLVFSDYMRPAIRLAALMRLKHLFIFSHDSFYVGEDGPTHQPVEQLTSLRLLPELTVYRPANDLEVGWAMLSFLEGNRPVVMITSRQNLSADVFAHALEKIGALPAREEGYKNFKEGAYKLVGESDATRLELVLMGTGSEISTLRVVQQKLEEKGHSVRLISAPCIEGLDDASPELLGKLFRSQSGATVPCYFAEAASYRGMNFFRSAQWTFKVQNTFGHSAPSLMLAKHLSFDAVSLVGDIEKQILRKS